MIIDRSRAKANKSSAHCLAFLQDENMPAQWHCIFGTHDSGNSIDDIEAGCVRQPDNVIDAVGETTGHLQPEILDKLPVRLDLKGKPAGVRYVCRDLRK